MEYVDFDKLYNSIELKNKVQEIIETLKILNKQIEECRNSAILLNLFDDEEIDILVENLKNDNKNIETEIYEKNSLKRKIQNKIDQFVWEKKLEIKK